MLEALRGKADADRNGYVTLLETVDYVGRQVPRKARELGARQEPLFDGKGITNAHSFVLTRDPKRLSEIDDETQVYISKLTWLFNEGHLTPLKFERAVRMVKGDLEMDKVLRSYLNGQLTLETFRSAF